MPSVVQGVTCKQCSGRPSGGRPSGGRPSGGRPSGGRPWGGFWGRSIDVQVGLEIKYIQLEDTL